MSEPTVRELHDKAMALVDEADMKRREGNDADYRRLCAEAFAFERQAADLLPLDRVRRGARGVLYRSAAWLAHNAGMYQEAFDTAQEGVKRSPPAWLQAELTEVINASLDALHSAQS